MSMYLSNLLLSLFSLPRLVSLWFKFAPRAFVWPPRSVVMDGLWHMNQRQIHHHVARAIMHLNYIAGTLPFFELAIEWEDSAPPPQHQTMLPPKPHHIHNCHLHTFAPMPSLPSSSSASMISLGGLPAHMVLNPEPRLRPIWLLFQAHLPFLGTHAQNAMTPLSLWKGFQIRGTNPEPTNLDSSSTKSGSPAKKKQRVCLDPDQDRSVPPPPESVPAGTVQKKTMILPQAMVFLFIDLQPRQLLQLLLLLTLVALFVNQIMNHLYHTP